jgi:dGTPase
MQVFTGDMGDYHRTRLTHTHEVASIARTIGRSLRLSEDLIEALALFHDIGHPPYGHAGEEALDQCLQNAGGFSHNQYALTIAEELEIRYHRFPGLNLTREVLAGQAVRADKQGPQQPLLEVQVVDVADSITYDAHDTDDAVKLGLVTLEDLARLELIQETLEKVRERLGDLNPELTRKAVVHELIDVQVSDVLHVAGEYLVEHPFASSEAARQSSFRLQPSAAFQAKKTELERFLYAHVYRHPRLVAMRTRAQHRLKTLFETLIEQENLLPPRFRKRAQTVGIERSVADYLAGMTDRFCEQKYEQLAAGRVVG